MCMPDIKPLARSMPELVPVLMHSSCLMKQTSTYEAIWHAFKDQRQERPVLPSSIIRLSNLTNMKIREQK